ncbi:MAG: hypothetical protein IJY06_09615 [Oscillospiraceae bacterium]|nr:hypothetical protein [Oscillospiraceae bacterium]
MKKLDINVEVPEIVNAKCQAAYAQIYKECEGMKRKKNIRMKRTHIIAACAAAALVIVPTSAIAYEYISARIEKTGTYQNTVTITPQETQAENAAEFMALNIGWLPEGYSLSPSGKYHSEQGGGITCEYIKLPKNLVVSEQINNSISSEQYAVDGKQIMISEKAKGLTNVNDEIYYNHEIWVVFDGTDYAAHAYLTSDLDTAAVKAFAEGLTLTPSDVETAGDYCPPETGKIVHGNDSAPKVLRDELNLIAIGEAAELNHTGLYAEDTISMTVTDAWLQKNFDGIDGDYSAYTDASGNAADVVRTWYNPGNGVDTLDEEVMSETLPQHVLVVKATFTNDSDHAVEHIIFPTLFTIRDNVAMKNGMMTSDIAERNTEFLHDLKADGGFFSIQSESGMHKNHITIPAGESVDVQLAYLVSEDMLGSLYMNMHLNFTLTKFDEKFPVLDLCDLQ